MNAALGLFHFNVQYVAGDLAMAHRYCTQSIMPFFRLIKAKPNWTISFEIAGSGLSFLKTHYPGVIDTLRELVNRKQIELISSMYYPSLWVAFPKRDLLRSIRLNQQLLRELDLKASRIFFSQEAFFGVGVQELCEHFDLALCKDEVLQVNYPSLKASPLYRLGEMPVLIGTNHLVNELAARHANCIHPGGCCCSGYGQKFKKGSESLSPSQSNFISGTHGEVSWLWYHMGSGHHLVNSTSPNNGEAFYCDAEWETLTESYLDELIARGYQLCGIQDLFDKISSSHLPPMPFVPESGWNGTRSQGVFTWMGAHANHWEDDIGLLGLVWKARTVLRDCEDMVPTIGESLSKTIRPQIEDAWRLLLLAQSSDPLGWKPTQTEVRFGKSAAESALRLASKMKFEIERLTSPGFPQIRKSRLPNANNVNHLLPMVTIVGQGDFAWTVNANNEPVCTAYIQSCDGNYGICFERFSDKIEYSPSGMEETVCIFEIGSIGSHTIYLPLSNGLLGLGNQKYLIRLNEWGQSAVQLSKTSRNIAFMGSGRSSIRTYQWRFAFYFGSPEGALARANEINRI